MNKWETIDIEFLTAVTSGVAASMAVLGELK
jgi:hypothetical protein